MRISSGAISILSRDVLSPPPLSLLLRLLLTAVCFTSILCAQALTYYVATAGSDSSNGLSPNTPFKTIARVNLLTTSLHPGDQVLLKAGDRFTDDYIRCQNLAVAVPAMTLANNPPQCSGSSTAPILFGRYGIGADPVIDAADILGGLVWRSLGNGVYSTPLATAPQKLYVDKETETPQIIPVPNYVGMYDPAGSTTYQPWDAVYVSSTGFYAMNGGNAPQKATIGGLGIGGAWASPYIISSTAAGETTQTFLPMRTGLENVAAIGGGSVAMSTSGGTGFPNSFAFSSHGGGSIGGYQCDVRGSMTAVNGVPTGLITYTHNRGCSSVPSIQVETAGGTGLKFFGRVDGGSFFYASKTENGALAHELYVHLADGSDPSNHTFYATHRPYGILLRGVNHLTVSHIQFAHQLKSGVLSYPYSNSTLAGQYWTNEYINVNHVTCWNTGDTVSDTLGWQDGLSRTAALEGCIVLRASGETNPHLVRGNAISDSWSGLIDAYYGSRGDVLHANFSLSGLDGTEILHGIKTNYPVIQYSYGRSHNAGCIRYGTAGLSANKLLLNQGGIVNNNECTDNASGNIYFGSTAGGRVESNFIHDSLGQGVQAGGDSTSVSDASLYAAQVFDHNIITNLGVSPSLMLYNGIDVNNGKEGPEYPYTTNLHVFNNTISNSAGACITFEANVVAAHMHDNVCSESSTYYPSGWMCPLCLGPTNFAASIYVRMASLQYALPMDWHHNVWENQGGPLSSWSVYNLQNVGSNRGTCTNLSAFLHAHNSYTQEDSTSFCTANPAFVDASSEDFTLQSSSPLRHAGTGGGDVGAIPYGKAMFAVGPRKE